MTDENKLLHDDMWYTIGEIESRWLGLKYMLNALQSTLTDEEKTEIEEDISRLQALSQKLKSRQ